MTYLKCMKKKVFIWKGTLAYLVLGGALIQAISAKIFGEKIFWIEEIVILGVAVLLYFSNKKYNSLVDNSNIEYVTFERIKRYYIPLISRTVSKYYIYIIFYKFQNKNNVCITVIEGKSDLERFENLLEEKGMPIAVSCNNKKYAPLIQEFFEVHGFQQGIEEDCYPMCLLIYIPKLLVLLIALYTNFIY